MECLVIDVSTIIKNTFGKRPPNERSMEGFCLHYRLICPSVPKLCYVVFISHLTRKEFLSQCDIMQTVNGKRTGLMKWNICFVFVVCCVVSDRGMKKRPTSLAFLKQNVRHPWYLVF